MTAETSLDWLPPGWTCDFRFQKTGRKIMQYVNLATGQKFFTKDDLIRHTKMEIKLCDDKLPKPVPDCQVNTAVKEDDHPEWLPKNWLTEVKTRKSGVTTGKQIKIYIDPSTRSKFYSKPQVLRFLNHAEQKVVIENSTVDDLPSGPTKEVMIKGNVNGVQSDSTAVNANEWLPENWLMEVKPGKSGITTGRQIKIYVDPSTGLKFYSKPQVLRFLNCSEQRMKNPKQIKRASHSRKEIVIEKSTADDLPSGWIKEVKMKRNAYGAYKYPCYTDPGTGYVFPSKKAVLRYLETGELAEGVLVPENHIDDQILNNGDESVVIQTSTDDDLPSGWIKEVQIKRSANGFRTYLYYTDPARSYVFRSKKAVLRYLDTGAVTKGVFLKEKNNDGQLLTDADESQLQAARRQKVNSKDSGESRNKRDHDLTLGFSNRLERLEPEHVASGLEHVKPCQNEAIEVEDVTGKQPQMLEIEKTGDTKSEVHPLFFSDLCPEFKTKTLSGGVPREGAADEGLVSTPASSVLQEKNLGKTRKEIKRSNTGTKSSSKSKKIKELDLPHLFSKQVSKLETELVSNGVVTEIPIQNATRKSGKNEAKSPCVLMGEATRQLNVGANATLPNQASPPRVNLEISNISPHEDKTMLVERPQMSGTQKGSDSKSEVEPLFCSDPCLEFAIKTLTGAIPLEDAIKEGLASTPIANIHKQKNLADAGIEHSRCRKTLFNSTRSKEDGSLHQRSSKQVAGHTPKLVENCLSNEQVLNFADRNCYDSKAIRTADLTSAELTEKSPQQLEIGPRMAYGTTLSHDESSNKTKEPRNNQTIPTQMNNEIPGQQSAIPSWSSWSGPCFQSPFRTVAGSSSVQSSFDFQRNFPDHILPTVFRSDIPLHVDGMRQTVLQQQFPSNPLLLLPSNVSLPRSSTISAQQSSRKGKRNYKTR